MSKKDKLPTYRQVAESASFKITAAGAELIEERAIRKMIKAARRHQQLELTEALIFIAMVLDVEPVDILKYLTDDEINQLREENK